MGQFVKETVIVEEERYKWVDDMSLGPSGTAFNGNKLPVIGAGLFCLFVIGVCFL